MEINTFWKIVLKGIGLWLLLYFLYVLPQFLSSVSFFTRSNDIGSRLLLLIGNIAPLLIYILIIRVFLFKSQWIINILKLDKNFNEHKIDVNISSSELLTIAIILIGGYMFLENLPLLFSDIVTLLKPREYINLGVTTDNYWIIYHFIIMIIGFLIMTNSKFVVNLIEKKSTAND